jgi:hypothetical protein
MRHRALHTFFALALVATMTSCTLFTRSDNSICSCAIPSAPEITLPTTKPAMTAAFLVDHTTWYAHVETDLPLLAIRSIQNSIKLVSWGPGDTIRGAWMTPLSPALGEDFLPVQSVARIPVPEIQPPPTPPTPPQGQVGCSGFCGSDVPNYKSRLDAWQTSATTGISSWKVLQDAEVTRFVDGVVKTLASIGSPRLASALPDINGAFYGTARFFEQHRPDKGTLKLVVFSGLIEKPGNTTPFDLTGVQVLVEAYHRHGADYQLAGESQWRTALTKAGATVKPFIADNATSPSDVSRFLMEGR